MKMIWYPRPILLKKKQYRAQKMGSLESIFFYNIIMFIYCLKAFDFISRFKGLSDFLMSLKEPAFLLIIS